MFSLFPLLKEAQTCAHNPHSAVFVFCFELSNPQIFLRVGCSFPAQLLKSTSLPSACTWACWKGPRQPLGVLWSLLLRWPFWGSDAAPCPPLDSVPHPRDEALSHLACREPQQQPAGLPRALLQNIKTFVDSPALLSLPQWKPTQTITTDAGCTRQATKQCKEYVAFTACHLSLETAVPPSWHEPMSSAVFGRRVILPEAGMCELSWYRSLFVAEIVPNSLALQGTARLEKA